ncbi:MAG: hypothetical protein ABW067_15460 [Rhizobacter sp.]
MRHPLSIVRLLAALLFASLAAGASPMASRAREVAWVWPGSAVPGGAGWHEAAVLLESIDLDGEQVVRRPRRLGLVAPKGLAVTPVVHVQSGPRGGARFTEAERRAVVAALRGAAEVATAGVVQLDFEAPRRQRDAWRELVAETRAALPTSVRLSVTALASWCHGGAWLDGVAADEVVPMLYRLGPDSRDWLRRWRDAPDSLHARCRGPAVGFSAQERPEPAIAGRYIRRYWFNERNWPLSASTPTAHAP